jgi:hypothetical protein
MTTQQSDDEFYIGYEGAMPPCMARRVRRGIAALGCAAAAVVATVVLASATLPASRFEFGRVTSLSGVLRRSPYPVLETGGHHIWLVGPGKSGADRVLATVPDGPVTLRGSRIQRGGHEMLEVHQADTSASVTLRGEIVDSKCYLGVMNPGEGPVHRDCARRCLSGGIPPMLVVRGGDRREQLVVLVSADGRPMSRELSKAAGVPVEATGRLEVDRGDYVMYVVRWNRQG